MSLKTGVAEEFVDNRGRLIPIELEGLLPTCARFFWIEGVPVGEERANHGLESATLLLVTISGCVDALVIKPDGSQTVISLPQRHWLLMPPKHFLTLRNFRPGTVLGVLASEPYDPDGFMKPGSNS